MSVATKTGAEAVAVIASVPESWFPLMWAWLQEDPEANFDDFGPQTEAAFAELHQALKVHERLWGVTVDGRPCGFVQYLPISPMVGSMHLCFSRAVWGSGVAREALRRIREELIADGVTKLMIEFFADNARVESFCRQFGAVTEGRLVDHTRTNGRLRTIHVMAIFAGQPVHEGRS